VVMSRIVQIVIITTVYLTCSSFIELELERMHGRMLARPNGSASVEGPLEEDTQSVRHR
jgi:hypothetical protein